MNENDRGTVCKIESLVGRVPIEIWGAPGAEEIVMHFSDGSRATFYHEQDCCEDVAVEEVAGDWSDLIGHPLLAAEERTREAVESEVYQDEGLWTFYTFRNVGGTVDVRWLGQSNGWYSESVDLKIEETTND